jgi:CheY-like chemotaxis protein
MSDPTPSGQPAPAADSEGEPPVRKLLYVEDQPANMILVEFLVARRANWKFLKAVNGNLAIIMAKANKPEVILLDINLPDISGYDVLRILRQDPALVSIPVIALSSNAFPKDIAKGLQAGFFRYLTKPYRINELMTALDDALHVAAQAGSGINRCTDR